MIAPTATIPDAIANASMKRAIGRVHPLRRGGYAAIVFSGNRNVLGELAGEATALTPHKFACVDPTLDDADDFARSSGATLPVWSAPIDSPVDGVCFVFSSSEHPASRLLQNKGAQFDEHYLITSGLATDSEDDRLPERLAELIKAMPSAAAMTILGFGRQGQRIAEHLVNDFNISRTRIMVWDSNPQSAAIAAAIGFRVIESEEDVCRSGAVIVSPLARYANFDVLEERARRAGALVLNNAQRVSGLNAWHAQGRVLLDEAAHRVLSISNRSVVSCRHPLLEKLTTVHVIREDARTLGGATMPHLYGGQSRAMSHAGSLDLAQRWPQDDLSEHTWSGSERAFVSVRDRPDFGFFAAREFCLGRWPDATRRVFPSEHAMDLGSTAFERLLLNHLDSREMVSTMQTPAQRVTLGVVAAHHASDRPIVEIGSALGGSSLHLAAATSDAGSGGAGPTIFSIDPDAPTREIMRFAMHREGYGGRVEQVVATSDEAVGRLQHLRDSCGLIFIDGLHTAKAVHRDFLNYAPLVALGGALAFHDVCPALHSVMQAVVDHVLPDTRFSARCLVDGLLVLERVG